MSVTGISIEIFFKATFITLLSKFLFARIRIIFNTRKEIYYKNKILEYSFI